MKRARCVVTRRFQTYAFAVGDDDGVSVLVTPAHAPEFQNLKEGDVISCAVVQTPKGLLATNVTRVKRDEYIHHPSTC